MVVDIIVFGDTNIVGDTETLLDKPWIWVLEPANVWDKVLGVEAGVDACAEAIDGMNESVNWAVAPEVSTANKDELDGNAVVGGAEMAEERSCNIAELWELDSSSNVGSGAAALTRI